MQTRSSRLIYAGIVLLALILTAGISSANYVNADLISPFGGSVGDVAVDGNYAYIGQGQDFVVLDITDVSNPSEVGRIITPSEVSDVTVEGDHAYVSSDGLLIVDISDLTLYFIFIWK